jgi:hypothetical protein
MVQFPPADQIAQFISNYPTDFSCYLYVANAFQMLASYFGKKKVHRDTIHEHVVIALDQAIAQQGDEEQQKLLKARQGIARLFQNKIASKEKADLIECTTPGYLKRTYEACELLLDRLLEVSKKGG